MTLLHESQVVQETPMTTEEIEAYIKLGIIFINNEDFDEYIIENNMIIDDYLIDPNYNVIELNY